MNREGNHAHAGQPVWQLDRCWVLGGDRWHTRHPAQGQGPAAGLLLHALQLENTSPVLSPWVWTPGSGTLFAQVLWARSSDQTTGFGLRTERAELAGSVLDVVQKEAQLWLPHSLLPHSPGVAWGQGWAPCPQQDPGGERPHPEHLQHAALAQGSHTVAKHCNATLSVENTDETYCLTMRPRRSSAPPSSS